MSTEFTREERYIVFKLSDVERYLTDKDRANIAMMKMEIDAGRDCANKPPFKGLIVEADWPEYEPTWKAIEARVTGAQPAPSVPDGVAEALQRLIENGAVLGPASSEDALLVARYRQRLLACAPNVPEGWQLVPTAESRHPGIYKMLSALHAADNTPGASEWESYRAMLAAAPEAKP